VTNTNNNGGGSLRQAIASANGAAGADTINFNIPGGGVHTIIPTTPLPAITGPVTIDGTTQPGYAGTPLIEIQGPAGGAAAGLDLQGGSSGSTIRGLVINSFTSGNAIRIQSSNNDVIAGNYLGTNAAGTAALGNQVGVYIQIGTNDRIGGTVAADRNVISGN